MQSRTMRLTRFLSRQRFAALLIPLIMFCLTTLVQAQTLTTTFANNNGSGGNMFEIKSLTGVVINSFDVNISGGTGNFEVWALNMPGPFLGNQSSNANWTLLATVTGVTGSAAGTPTPLNLNLGFAILPGVSQSFYIARTSGGILNYTNGTAVGNLFVADSNIEFYEGTGGGYFNVTIQTRIWNGNIHYLPLSSVADDMQLSKIVAPVNDTLDCSPRSATETVTIEARNIGMNPVPIGTFLTLSFQVDTNTPTFEFVTTTTALAVGDTLSHTFVGTADLSAVGNHTLTASILYSPDLDPSNDTLAIPIGSGGQLRVTTFPYLEDFTVSGFSGTTQMPLGWIQETADASGANSDWFLRDDPTPTNGTGPSADHTTGISGMGGYAVVDDNGNFTTVNLRSPCFDLSGFVNPNLRFYMHSNNNGPSNNESMLSVDVITYPGATVIPDVFGPQGHIGNTWTMQAVGLSAFTGQVIQFVFRGNTSGTGSAHDIAIDDVSVVDLLATPGQAPQNGLAILDLNNPKNANNDPLAFGFGGPYFSTATQGDSLIFKMIGESLQPILLFSGPLNPAAASFPGIGKIDLGGPIDPMTGLPTLLTVLADGSAIGGFNPFFVTAANGEAQIAFTVPNLPIGVLGNFQCAFFTASSPFVALSNAVQLSIF